MPQSQGRDSNLIQNSKGKWASEHSAGLGLEAEQPCKHVQTGPGFPGSLRGHPLRHRPPPGKVVDLADGEVHAARCRMTRHNSKFKCMVTMFF
jgi:hypothetical protein